MPKLRAVIFDIGRVLIGWTANAEICPRQGLPFTPEEFIRIEKDPRWPTGRSRSPPAIGICTFARFNLSLDFEASRTPGHSASIRTPSTKLPFRGLSKSYRLGLLSNRIQVTWKTGIHLRLLRHFPQTCSAPTPAPWAPASHDPHHFRDALRACKVRAERRFYLTILGLCRRRPAHFGLHVDPFPVSHQRTRPGEGWLKVEDSCRRGFIRQVHTRVRSAVLY